MSSQSSPLRELTDPWLQEPADPALLCRVGAWELTTRIAASPWVEVHRARAVGTGETGEGRYVVKMVSGCGQDSSQTNENVEADRAWSLAMLAREWEAGRSIASPHVVSVLAGELDHPWPHITFAYLPGQTLGDKLDLANAQRQLAPATAAWIARQIAQGLDAVHRAGWIHGDVSSDNIHLGWNGHATLLDLGFALKHEEGIAPGPFDPLCCTPRYAAPEQFDTFRGISPATDIYSLGCVLHECLLGTVPHDYPNLDEQIAARRVAPPDSLARIRPEIPSDLDRLVRTMLARDPLRRPTADQVVEQLIAIEVALLGQPMKASPPEARLNPERGLRRRIEQAIMPAGNSRRPFAKRELEFRQKNGKGMGARE